MRQVREDRTFHEASLYGSAEWAAATMGLSKDNFFRRRPGWEAIGFPKPDHINKMYLKADVHAWVARRRKLSDRIHPSEGVQTDASGSKRVNIGAL